MDLLQQHGVFLDSEFHLRLACEVDYMVWFSCKGVEGASEKGRILEIQDLQIPTRKHWSAEHFTQLHWEMNMKVSGYF